MFEIGHLSHPGKKRQLNEDTYDLDATDGWMLLVDGMGGPDAGDIASAFVRERLRESLQCGESPADALRSADRALRVQRPQRGIAPSGASALAARFIAGSLELAWLGACRAIYSNGRNYHEIVAHSDAHSPPAKTGAVLSIQALGVTATDKLTIAEANQPMGRGDSVLLCTDGLLEACSANDWQAALCNNRMSAQESVEMLLLQALRNQASDNLSALLLRRN